MKRLVLALAPAVALLACAVERPLAADGELVPVAAKPDGGASLEAAAGFDAAAVDSAAEASPEPDRVEAGAADPEAGAPDAGPITYESDPLCPPAIVLGAGTLLSFSTVDDDRGLTVTPDGLSAAWTTASGALTEVHYVDRASSAESFGPERVVTGVLGSRHVALQSDGLGLALVAADGLGLSYLARADRNEAFGAPVVGPFELLATQGAEELGPAGERFDHPVFARDDMYLLYTRVGPTSARTFVSTRFSTSAPFAGGAPFAEAALGGAGGQRRAVTGASTDVRALFVWDEVAEKSRLVTLTAAGAVANDVELGVMRDVQVSADCKTFWFGRAGDLYREVLPGGG